MKTEAVAPGHGKGGYLIAVPRGVLDRLKAMRGAGESYGGMTILRALKGDRARVFASKRPALIEPALT